MILKKPLPTCRKEGTASGSPTRSAAGYPPGPRKIREKIFKNYALKSIDAVYNKLNEAIGYINRNPQLVKSITPFRYIVRSF
jgi:hypothetical protein